MNRSPHTGIVTFVTFLIGDDVVAAFARDLNTVVTAGAGERGF